MTTCQAELKLWSAMEKLNQSRRSQDVHANTILYTAIKSVRSGASVPFYWTQAVSPEEARCYVAPSGWYQWRESGLVYIGESILEKS